LLSLHLLSFVNHFLLGQIADQTKLSNQVPEPLLQNPNTTKTYFDRLDNVTVKYITNYIMAVPRVQRTARINSLNYKARTEYSKYWGLPNLLHLGFISV
jgi:hypothetical protein